MKAEIYTAVQECDATDAAYNKGTEGLEVNGSNDFSKIKHVNYVGFCFNDAENELRNIFSVLTTAEQNNLTDIVRKLYYAGIKLKITYLTPDNR